MAEAPEHNLRFIERYKVAITDYEWVDRLREAKGETIPFPDELDPETLRVNDPLVINGTILARVRPDGISVVKTTKMTVCGIQPRGFEQYFAMELMLDPTVQCVTLYGIAGSGKTTLALAAALHMCKAGKYHNGIHLLKPVSYVGRSMGLLPGELEQKLAPFIASMTQHLEGLIGQNESLNSMVHPQAVEYQRGMNYIDSIVIIDEGQNLGEHEMYTLLTRVGEGSKIFICGDLTQIDERDIKKNKTSGLSMVVNNFRAQDDEDIADVQFFKSERKGISLKAVERLGHISQ